MFFWGRLIGAIVGIPAGVYGIIFGFLVGFLIDQMIMVRRNRSKLEKYLRHPASSSDPGHSKDIVAAIALGVCLVTVDDHLQNRQVESIKEYISVTYSINAKKLQALRGVIDESFRLGQRINIDELTEKVAEYKDREERRILLEFYIKIAQQSPKGLTRRKRELLEYIGQAMSFSIAEIRKSSKALRSLDPEACSILGVKEDAGLEEIKRVYRILASQFHPDRAESLDENRRRESGEAFVRIKAAYDKLLQAFDEEENDT